MTLTIRLDGVSPKPVLASLVNRRASLFLLGSLWQAYHNILVTTSKDVISIVALHLQRDAAWNISAYCHFPVLLAFAYVGCFTPSDYNIVTQHFVWMLYQITSIAVTENWRIRWAEKFFLCIVHLFHVTEASPANVPPWQSSGPSRHVLNIVLSPLGMKADIK